MADTPVSVVIPAHNEADGIVKTLDSLAEQTIRPDRIVVVADNCTDNTVVVARQWGAVAIATVDNEDKKAGALNQVLPRVLHTVPDNGAVLVMDADSTLNSEFIENALRTFTRDSRIGAVSSTFYGEPGGGFVGLLQRMEYEQYAFEVRRRRDTLVLSGTATIFRADVLRRVARSRGDELPGEPGTLYYTKSITEDNELTLAIRKLGWRTVQPTGCDVLTEVMPTWRALAKQRLRWKRGTIEDIRLYGVSKLTLPYLLQQLELIVSTFARVLIVVMLTTMIGAGVEWKPLWSVIGLVFVVVPVISVRRMGWKPMLVAASVLPQLGYRIFQEWVLVLAYYRMYLHLQAQWHHLTPESGTENPGDAISGNESSGKENPDKEGSETHVRIGRSGGQLGRGERDAGLHRSEHRMGGGRGAHPAVRGTGAAAADQEGQARVADERTRFLPVTGTLPRAGGGQEPGR